MAVVNHACNGEILIISIEVARLVDGDLIDQCCREIIAILDKTEEKCATLYFGRVSFMSSAALGMLVRVNKKCKEYNIELRLCNISSDIRQVFKITGLDKVFPIHADVNEAQEAFKKSGRLMFRKKAPTTYEV
jgi:anti-anti-sigma factor